MGKRGAARPAGPHRLDGLPGTRAGAEPVDPGRPAGRRGVRDRRRVARGGAGSAEDMLRKVQITGPRPGHAAVPAPALRRDGAAGRDRDGAGRGPSLLILDEPTTALDATVEAEVLDLVAALRAGVRHLGAVHQPQPGGDRQDVRPGRGALRGRARRGGPGAHRSSTTRATPTRSGCCAASRAAGSARTAAGSTPSPASCPRPARPARLRVRRRAARSRRTAAASEAPPLFDVGDRRTSRCHFHEQAPDLPRATPASVAALAADRSGEPLVGVEGVSKTFAGSASRRSPAWTCPIQRGRDARPGRRVGQRQDHAGPGRCSGSSRPTRARSSTLDGQPLARTRGGGRGRPCARCRSSSRTPTRR